MRTFVGDPTDFKILLCANAENADIFVSVTANTSDNLVACAMEKSMGSKRTIARVDRYDFMEFSKKGVVQRMGVDSVVYPDYLAAEAIVSLLKHPWCRSWNEFDNGSILLAAVSVKDDTTISGCQLKDFASDNRNFHVSALRRNNKTIIPRGSDYILPNDILYVTSIQEGINRL